MLGAAALICWTVDTVVLQIGYPPSVSCLTRRSRVRVHALACFLFNIPFLPSAGRSMSPWPCDDVRHVAVSCLIRCLVVMADRESTGKTRGVMFRCGSVPLRRRKLSSALPLSFSFPIRHGPSLLILRARKEFFGRALIARLSISQYGYRFFFWKSQVRTSNNHKSSILNLQFRIGYDGRHPTVKNGQIWFLWWVFILWK